VGASTPPREPTNKSRVASTRAALLRGNTSYSIDFSRFAFGGASGLAQDSPAVLGLMRCPRNDTTPSGLRFEDCRAVDKAPTLGITKNPWLKTRLAWSVAPGDSYREFADTEHFDITVKAISVAGLGANPIFARPYWVRYPGRDAFVSSPIDGPDGLDPLTRSAEMVVGQSYVPTTFGDFGANVTRSYFLPDLSQLPDVSHSLSDWAAGNETCPIADMAGSYGNTTHVYDMSACHEFDKVMGALNASHFKGSSKTFYERYHQLALFRMDECKDLKIRLERFARQKDIDTYSTEWQRVRARGVRVRDGRAALLTGCLVDRAHVEALGLPHAR